MFRVLVPVPVALVLLAVVSSAPAAGADEAAGHRGRPPVASAGPVATGRAELPAGEGPWVLRVSGWSEADLEALGARFDHLGVYREKGIVLLQADDRDDLDWLAARGLSSEVDRDRTATLEKIALYRSLGVEQIDAIPGFECYRSVEEMLDRGAEIAAAYPDLAEWVDLGDTWEKIHPGHGGPGYDIRVLRLTNRDLEGHKPALLVTGSTHAREYTTPELVTRFAELLVSRYGVDPDVTWLLDHHRIELVLVQNPDGRKRAETGLLWRKNADDDACTGSNSRGIDLNRNFDFMWGFCNGSSGSQCAETYRGAAPASEPETQAVQNHMVAVFPDQRPDDQTTPAPRTSEGIYLDIHSFGGDVLSSWGCVGQVGPPPGTNGDDICTLGRKYGYFTGYPARIGSTSAVDGSSKDFTYGRLGVPGYTIETGTAFFEECPYFETVILEANLDAMLQTAKNVRTSYMTAWGPDVLGLSVPALPVAAGDAVALTATVDDTRYGPAVGGSLCATAPTPISTVAAAELYVDVPPWEEGTPLALTASDGAFDEGVEGVETSLATASLAPGRHLLYARGRDAHDDLGAVSSVFLHVIDPATSPLVSGTVTERGSGDPIAATVSIGSFEVPADAGGAWQLQVPPGTYDVTARAAGYAPTTRADVVLAENDSVVVDLELSPLEVLLADDVEGGNAGWTAQAPWAITTESSNSPTHSWTDSPGGNYAANADTSLTSPVLDLTGLAGTRLAFRHIYDFEAGFDGGAVEVSTDGTTFTRVATFSAQDHTGTWDLVELDLPMLDGASTARIRFRVTADGGLQRDGWHVDDILISAGTGVLVFQDGFESGDTSAWTTTAQ